MELGIGDREFWQLTPAQLTAMWSARREAVKREDYRAGILTAVVRQAVGEKNAEIFDYFPEYKTAQKRSAEPSAEEIRQRMRSFVAEQERVKKGV